LLSRFCCDACWIGRRWLCSQSHSLLNNGWSHNVTHILQIKHTILLKSSAILLRK
jgi:hypothetical protein